MITPMLTPGGEHSEVEIPAQVDEARVRHPGVEFAYAWPYAMSDVAAFLARRATCASSRNRRGLLPRR